MTEFSTDRAGAHGASALRVSGSDPSAEGTDVFGAVEAYVVQGLALETLYDGGSGWWFGSVRDDNGIAASSGLHNHLQSSRECNTSRALSRSTSSVNPSPASLSQHSIVMISFPWGKGGCSSRVARKGVGSSSKLGDRLMVVSVEDKESVGEEFLAG